VTVRISLVQQRDASYDILIDHGLLTTLPERLRADLPAARYAVISDSHVSELYGKRLVQACQDAGLSVALLSFPAGEWNKTRDTWAALSDRLLAGRFGRDSAIVALGGGVVGDIAGFVSATYLRGIPYVQVPTSLLAMIDSSVGGKTGVDTPAGKNLVGVFHQPRLVVADLDVLATLPVPHLTAGAAEAIKHGVIADAEYFDSLERDGPAVLDRDTNCLMRLVARSVEIKAALVSGDEREAGRRAVLNFGHTIGHALEATSGYALLHGEAVAIGMVLEARVAEQLGVAEAGTRARIDHLVERLGLPRERPQGASVDEVIVAMRQDKKNRGERLRMAVPRRIGTMAGNPEDGWTTEVSEDLLHEVLD